MPTTNSSTFALSLPSDLEIRITRVFDAPRELVFEAWTRPEHLSRWWGCDDMTMTTCEMDVRPGGAWRYVVRMPDGQEWGFHGEYQVINRPHKLIYTFVYEPYPDHPAVVTMELEDLGGKTRFTETTRHESIEGRDGHLQADMEKGAAESLDRLSEFLATIG